ncbi:MAG: hypothetical protein U5L09_10510 [Bacteroidales bacterium]|nr:hypothetical protein [Bacteroidales bacterium]
MKTTLPNRKNDEAPVKEKITYERSKPKKHNGRNRIPDNLPVIEHVVEPDEDVSGMKKIGERTHRDFGICP